MVQAAARSDQGGSKAIATGLDGALLLVARFAAEIGLGMQGSVDRQDYVLGNHSGIEERKQCSADLGAPMQAHEVPGRSVRVLASSQGMLALFAVADTAKASSKDAVAELRQMGVATVMLTGDNQAAVKAIVDHVGITEVRAKLLPVSPSPSPSP